MPKIELGKKYRTRDGRDVRVLCVDRDGDYPVVALISNKDLKSFTPDGTWQVDITGRFDLIEVAPLVERWHTYECEKCGIFVRTFGGFSSRDEAICAAREHGRSHIGHAIYDPNTDELKVEVEKV